MEASVKQEIVYLAFDNKLFQVMLAFYDPSQDLKFPGWPLRNLLILAAIKWQCQNIRVFCYREKKGQADFDRCLIGDVIIPGELLV